MHLHICTIICYDFAEVSAFYVELLVYHYYTILKTVYIL